MISEGWGLWSLTPLIVTLILAFITRSALVAMLVGVFVGTLMVGAAPGSGLDQLFQSALGNADFIWIVEIVILIGVLFQCFKQSGVLVALPKKLHTGKASRRRVELTAWGMGFLIVDDYFPFVYDTCSDYSYQIIDGSPISPATVPLILLMALAKP